MLRELAEALQAIVVDRGVLARFGGNEFAVLAPNVTLEELELLAAALRAALVTLEAEQGTAGPMTLTAGLAVYPGHGENGAELMEAAKQAVYQGKWSGRECLAWSPASKS